MTAAKTRTLRPSVLVIASAAAPAAELGADYCPSEAAAPCAAPPLALGRTSTYSLGAEVRGRAGADSERATPGVPSATTTARLKANLRAAGCGGPPIPAACQPATGARAAADGR